MTLIRAASIVWTEDVDRSRLENPPVFDGIPASGWDIHMPRPTSASAQSLRALPADPNYHRNTRIVSVSVALGPPASLAADAEDAELANLRDMVESAGRLDAELFVLFPPAVTAGDAAPPVTLSSYDQSLNRTYAVTKQLAYDAERADLTLTVCAPYRGALLSPVELRELIDALAAPNLGICADSSHLSTVGRAEDWTTILGPRLHAVRTNTASSLTSKALVHTLGSQHSLIVIHESG